MIRILALIHAFVGLGAMGGGLGAILNPEGPMGISVELLKNSPFSNYLIPGIFLFTVIGLGNVFTAVVVYLKSRHYQYISFILGSTLVLWIIVQCIMLQTMNYLHVIFFITGLVEAVLAVMLIFRHSIYPANIIVEMYRGRSKKG